MSLNSRRGWTHSPRRQKADRLRSQYNFMLHNLPDHNINQYTRWCRNAYPPSPPCGSSVCWSNCLQTPCKTQSQPANRVTQLKSQVCLSPWCIHEPHARRPHALVRRNICTKRSPHPLPLLPQLPLTLLKDHMPPQSSVSRSLFPTHTPPSHLS